MKQEQYKGDLLMVLVICIWGGAYPFSKQLLSEIDVFHIMTYRFLIGFIVCLILFRKSYRKLNFEIIKCCVIVGVSLFVTFLFMNFGVQYTSASNAGFLSSLSVIFVQLFTVVRSRRLPGLTTVVSILLTIGGLALLCLDEGIILRLGDLLSIGCAFFYAVYMMLVKKYERTEDPVILGSLPLLFVGLFSAAGAALTGGFKLPYDAAGVGAMLYLGILCSGAAFLLQAVAQSKTSTAHISLIYAAMPIPVAVFSAFVTKEQFGIRDIVGIIVVIGGILVSEMEGCFRGKLKPSSETPV